MKTILLTIAIWLSLHTYASATTITTFWTDEDIVIGADSKIIFGGIAEAKFVCKIGVLNGRNALWADAGILTVSNNWSPIVDIVNKFVNQPLTMTEVFNHVATGMQDFISSIKNDYRKMMPGTPIALQIIFGYFSDGEPAIEFIQVASLPPDYSVQTSRIHCPSNDISCVRRRLNFGQIDAVNADLAANPEIVSQLGVRGAIERFIDEESHARPNDVGGPVAIARLTNSKVEWIEKGECDNPPERYTCTDASDLSCSGPK
jgi:hypothetical protein